MNRLSVTSLRLPRWVRHVLHSIASGRGFLGRLADRARFGAPPSGQPTLPKMSDAETRLVIGPANEAGQGWLWAVAVRENLTATDSLAVRGIGGSSFNPRVDYTVPLRAYMRSTVWQEAFEDLLSQQSHIIWESGLPLLGRRYRDTGSEIEALTKRGLRGALIFHGSDIRPPAGHARTHPLSPFRQRKGEVGWLADASERNARLIETTGLPVFVSTPDLLEWVPGAEWCPVVIDVDRWAQVGRSTSPNPRPVVAHAPSHPWLKGTDLLEPVLMRLDAEGVIEYRRLESVAHDSMPEFYGSADVMVDQFRMGIYGVAACEAMAAGTLVMSHVSEKTRRLVSDLTGKDLPIVEVNTETLESLLREFARDRSAFSDCLEAGVDFVREVHDGRRSAAALKGFLGA